MLTNRLKEVGKILGIQVVEHVILGYATYVSLKERGQIQLPLFDRRGTSVP